MTDTTVCRDCAYARWSEPDIPEDHPWQERRHLYRCKIDHPDPVTGVMHDRCTIQNTGHCRHFTPKETS